MNWMRYRLIYFLISVVVIGAGIFGLAKWGLAFGVDFKGGSIAEYKFENAVSEEGVLPEIEKLGVQITSVQKTSEKSYLFRLPPIDPKQKEDIGKTLEDFSGGKVEELRFENVGPSIGPELIKKTLYAIAIAASGILLWVSLQFKSFKFGTSAVLAMLHDSLVLIGSWALLGHFAGAEIDFLFVTAMLTILSFSVHDTIVVYDRVRETRRRVGGSTRDTANMAISQTMVRSLNNSFTIIFMLIALILLGGSTIKWFAVALFIGTVSGTYSSPFVAVPILVTWDEIEKRVKEKRLLKK